MYMQHVILLLATICCCPCYSLNLSKPAFICDVRFLSVFKTSCTILALPHRLAEAYYFQFWRFKPSRVAHVHL
ncbi:hypothetical protein F5B20DRAFT_556967, partial [Whalleya microplaca]